MQAWTCETGTLHMAYSQKDKNANEQCFTWRTRLSVEMEHKGSRVPECKSE